MENKIKAGLLIGFTMVIIGFLLWSELSFMFIGFGVVIIGISLIIHINKNN
ncbi:MAG: hypothetical protein PHW32_01760 [Bacilli bacterium]|nr:hypothetical protein [Bacilli bacterium]MDD4282322.1 hypothetical protein [Bacilli bacterium]MDD4718326.1 hypothetical protein [Bacilli bacterium]